MGGIKRLTWVVVVFCTLTVSSLSCGLLPGWFTVTLTSSDKQVTLKEAAELNGVNVLPVPTYLPNGYSIQEVYVHPFGSPVRYNVILLISDSPLVKKPRTYTDRLGTHQVQDAQCRLQMRIRWFPNPVPGGKAEGKTVDINGSVGVIQTFETSKSLGWVWQPPNVIGDAHFDFEINAPKSFPNGELSKIARSARY